MKPIEDLRKDFEETELFIRLKDCFEVYYTNLGGYHYVNGGDCSFYLNGAFAMFQELNK